MWYIVVDHWNGIHLLSPLWICWPSRFLLYHVLRSELPQLWFRNTRVLVGYEGEVLHLNHRDWKGSIMHADWIVDRSLKALRSLLWRCHWRSNFMTWWNLSRERRVSREGVNWKSKESSINSRYVILYGCRYDFFHGCLVGKWTANSEFEANPKATRITIGVFGNPLRASHGNTRDGQGALCNAEFVRQHKGHDSGTYVHSNHIANCKIDVCRCKIYGRRI